MYFLAKGGEANSSLYARELIGDEGLVPLLVSGSDTAGASAKCVLGMELLAHFLSVQGTAEYTKPLTRHVHAWCGRCTTTACVTLCHACPTSPIMSCAVSRQRTCATLTTYLGPMSVV